MFGIDLGSRVSTVLGKLGLDKLIDSRLVPLAASAFLGPVAGPIAAQFAAPLVKEILGGSSDAIVRDHRRPVIPSPHLVRYERWKSRRHLCASRAKEGCRHSGYGRS